MATGGIMNTTKINPHFDDGTTIAFQPDSHRRHGLLYNVKQIGHISCKEDYLVSREKYDSFSIVYVTEGQVFLVADGEEYVAKKGDLLFYDQNKPNLLSTRGKRFEADFLYLFGPNTERFFRIFHRKFGCVCHTYNPALLQTIVQTVAPAISSNREDVYETSEKLYSLLVDLLRYCDGAEEGDGNISDAVDFLQNHYAEKFNLSDLTKKFYMSASSFIRSFHARTGYSPKEYHRELRFRKAKALLETTDLSVRKISEKVGFTNSRDLIRLFQSKKEVTPAQYRIAHKTITL